MQVQAAVQESAAAGGRRYPLLSGAFLVALAFALMLVTWAVGTETYPYIHQRVVYRFPRAST